MARAFRIASCRRGMAAGSGHKEAGWHLVLGSHKLGVTSWETSGPRLETQKHRNDVNFVALKRLFFWLVFLN